MKNKKKDREFEKYRETSKEVNKLIYQDNYAEKQRFRDAIYEIERKSRELGIQNNSYIINAITKLKDINSRYRTLVIGEKGEFSVYQQLDTINRDKIILQNVQLEKNNHFIEIDDIVITDSKIFIVEVKNYSENMMIEENGLFRPIINNCKYNYNIANNLNEKKYVLSEILKKEFNITIDDDLIQCIVVNANDRKIINNLCNSVRVFYTKDCIDYINNYKGNTGISLSYMLKIQDVILDNETEREFEPDIDFDDVIEATRKAVEVIEKTNVIEEELIEEKEDDISWGMDWTSFAVGALSAGTSYLGYKLIKKLI